MEMQHSGCGISRARIAIADTTPKNWVRVGCSPHFDVHHVHTPISAEEVEGGRGIRSRFGSNLWASFWGVIYTGFLRDGDVRVRSRGRGGGRETMGIFKRFKCRTLLLLLRVDPHGPQAAGEVCVQAMSLCTMGPTMRHQHDSRFYHPKKDHSNHALFIARFQLNSG